MAQNRLLILVPVADDPRGNQDMRVSGIILYGGLAAVAAGMLAVHGHGSVRSAEIPVDDKTPIPVFQALEEPATTAEPIAVQVLELRPSPKPVEVKEPVQPLEERGDAMLFEIDALGGTPFDHAATMPFD